MGKIIVDLDVELAKNKMTLTELSEEVGISLSNLSILKTNKAKAVRFSTLEVLCQIHFPLPSLTGLLDQTRSIKVV